MENLQYPIGRFEFGGSATADQRRQWIEQIASTPPRVREAINGLLPAQLDTPYRPGGWTIRQVVHHLPDSHLNSYVRTKLALTEDQPTIKPYDEGRWAELTDARSAPLEMSLSLLASLHERWTVLLKSLGEADFARSFRHPELGVVTIEKNVALYAWHGRHHIGHITALRQRMGWLTNSQP
jgi:hypothetical protein